MTPPRRGSEPGRGTSSSLQPRSLAEALRAAGVSSDRQAGSSETASEEDYDEIVRPSLKDSNSSSQRRRTYNPGVASKGGPSGGVTVSDTGKRAVPDSAGKAKDLLRASREDAKDGKDFKRRRKFSDMAFSRQFSAFDRHNIAAASSPFYGFYTLFWIGVSLYVLKISADNWRTYGTPLGSNDIMRTMFRRDGEHAIRKLFLHR